MNDDKQAKEIAAAIWALKDELEKTNILLERVIGWDDGYATNRRIYFVRTLDITPSD